MKLLITFDHILHTYAYQPCLTTGMRYSIFVDQGVAENQSGLVKLLIWNIWIKFCIVIIYLYEHRPATGVQSGNETSWSVISAGRGAPEHILI